MKKYQKILSIIICVYFILIIFTGCATGEASSLSSVSSAAAPSSRITNVAISVPFSPPQSTDASSVPQEVVSEVASVSSEIPPQPAPQFLQGGITVTEVDGKAVSVQVKTNVPSAVNYVLSTVGDAVSTTEFYNYVNRGMALEGAVSSGSAFMVDENGKTITVTLPDTTKTYYLLLNAAENQTNTWQNSVTVVKIFDANSSVPGGEGAPELVGTPQRLADTDTELLWLIEAERSTRVYILVGPGGWDAPSREQVRGGKDYAQIYKTYQLNINAATAPFSAQISLKRADYSPGAYTAWLVLQDTGNDANPISEVYKLGDFVI